MKIRNLVRTVVPGAVLAGGLLFAGVASGDLSAQNVDSRWLPWLGCWEAAQAGSEGPLLCIRPLQEAGGVELFTWAEGKITSSEAIRADGMPRDADRDGCLGVEEASFSDGGKRVYLSSQYVCEGGEERNITGVLAMVNPVEWVDIKVLDAQGQQRPWVLRYRMARQSRVEEAGLAGITAQRTAAIRAARIAVSEPLTPEDLIEASGKVAPEAMEALIAEAGDPFAVDADMLVRLADAGVPENVIDVVVAVSFPDYFALQAQGPEELEADRGRRPAAPMGMFGFHPRFSFWNPFFYDPFYYGSYGYSPYSGYGYGYGGYGGYWGFGGYYRPTTVHVQPRTGSLGRMIKGSGYTRGGSSSSGSSRGAVRRGSSGGSSSSGAVRSSGGSGSSSGSSGRRAVRRGGGGGGGGGGI